MASATIELVEIQAAEKQEFWPILREYLHELDTLRGIERPSVTELEYPHWESYWDGSPDRHKYWIVIGNGKVGFILFRELPAEEWPEPPAPTQITEFCILRPFRSREIGSSVLKFLFDDFRSRGELLTWDCLEMNARAEKMYDRTVVEYRATAGADWKCRKIELITDVGRTFRYICGPE